MGDSFTESQIQIQANCYRHISKQVASYIKTQKLLPEFLRDNDEELDAMIGTITRWTLEENVECLVPIESEV